MGSAARRSGVFGRYVLLEQLGQGGMAQVWRARPSRAASDFQEVVVKTLHPRLAHQSLFAEMFAIEARLTRKLTHPGIVQVIDDGVVEGVPYLVMQRVDGSDLSALNRALAPGRRCPIEVALSIGVEMCRAVGYAHDWRDENRRHRPIVHGDLTPSNVMIRRDGGVTLIDFGLAQMGRRVAKQRAHLVIGKTGYLAPEMLDQPVADPRCDVFSLGVVLYELLVGRRLFTVESERETLRRLHELVVPPPSSANPRVTPALDAIVLRALHRNPARRFATATQLADALEELRSPQRAARETVAALVKPLLARGPRNDDTVTRPIAPAAPLSARLATALAIEERRGGPEGAATQYERPPRRAEEAPPPPRRRRGKASLLLFAAVVLILGMLVPVPNAPAEWWPDRSVAPAASPQPTVATPPASFGQVAEAAEHPRIRSPGSPRHRHRPRQKR